MGKIRGYIKCLKGRYRLDRRSVCGSMAALVTINKKYLKPGQLLHIQFILRKLLKLRYTSTVLTILFRRSVLYIKK